MRKKYSFIGKIKTFIDLEKIAGHNCAYYSLPSDILFFEGDIGLAIFENSNFEVISQLRRKREKLPIILIDDHFNNKLKKGYESLGVEILADVNKLPDKIKEYIAKK